MLRVSTTILLVMLALIAFGQEHEVVQFKFGKGLRFTSKDSSFYLKFSARIQNRYDGVKEFSDSSKYESRFFVRRARIKFDGHVVDPKIVYKIELDVVGGVVLDAAVQWNFFKNFVLWFGQAKLPGNRERVISSQKLQFVDRSLLNSKFTLDRDKGIQLHHHHSIGQVLLREIVSISMGEGKNYTQFGSGYDYTGRFEILPMGQFSKKGDYVGADIYREKKPKLSLAFTFDYNNKSIREHGQTGDIFEQSRNLKSYFSDLMFKFKGFSVMAEFAHRSSNGSPVIDSLQSFYTGWGVNIQTGYVFKKNWELAGRFTQVDPEDITPFPMLREYTFAISKYIVGHSLKVQSDFSYLEEELSDSKFIFRLQVELSF